MAKSFQAADAKHEEVYRHRDNLYALFTDIASSHYGYTFEWTDDHMTESEASKLRYRCDDLADRVLDRIDKISPPTDASSQTHRRKRSPKPDESTSGHPEHKKPLDQPPEPAPPQRDLFALLRDNQASDPVLHQLWEEVTTIPSWVDWPQLSRGQDVFYRYGGANLTGLAYQSLLGGMGAARVVETLARTGGFSTKVARRRMFETTQHILQVTRSLDSLKPPSGEGFEATVRVRLLHAMVRRRILRLASSRPEYYSVEAHGIPINDLDSAATIATFSATLMFLSLPRQGILPLAHEVEDYIALWRYVAHVIGAPTAFFSSSRKARALMESVFLHEVHPTDTSAVMANNIILSLQGQPPGNASAEFLIASARWLNGPKLSDALKLPRPSLYYSLLMLGQCAFFAGFAYAHRVVPGWDKKHLQLLRKVFWQLVVESKFGLEGKETKFDFTYVPEYETLTELGMRKEGEGGPVGIERRNLRALIILLTVVSIGLWVWIKVALWTLRMVF